MVVIPARAGSKGIPGKNGKLLAGKPLLAYTLEVAKNLVPAAQIVVSTDSPELAALANRFGIDVPFLRPAALATDEAGMFGVLRHALHQYLLSRPMPGSVILLQPTSPFRRAEQVRQAFGLYSPDLDMVASVKQTKANPYFVLFEENREGLLEKSKTLPTEVNRRQDAPKVYELNGAVYVINPAALEAHDSFADFARIRKYEMDSVTSVDLDTKLDWEFAEFLMARNKHKG